MPDPIERWNEEREALRDVEPNAATQLINAGDALVDALKSEREECVAAQDWRFKIEQMRDAERVAHAATREARDRALRHLVGIIENGGHIEDDDCPDCALALAAVAVSGESL